MFFVLRSVLSLLVLSAVLVGCKDSPSISVEPSLSVEIPKVLQARALPSNGILTAYIIVDPPSGTRHPLQVNSVSNTVSGTIQASIGPHTLQLVFEFTDNSYGKVVLARVEASITVGVGSNNSLSFDSQNYDYSVDADGDAFSNVDELLAGTDPTDNQSVPIYVNPFPLPQSLPEITGATLTIAPKELQFSWDSVAGADHYRLLENADGMSGFSVIASNITATHYNHSIAVHQTDWLSAQYRLEACDANEVSCVSWVKSLNVIDSVAAIAYLKAFNTGSGDEFGISVSLSGDGQTLAVGARGESSSAIGVMGDQTDNTAPASGAVYLFTHTINGWRQEAYLKAVNSDAGDWFGFDVSLSGDGQTLAVGAPLEDSRATGVNGNKTDNQMVNSGAVYLFVRDVFGWNQQEYLKASNTGSNDWFGASVSLSGDGQTLAIGAFSEDSNAVGVNGNQLDNTAIDSGAVYVFSNNINNWSQRAYIKASNAEAGDWLGSSISLSDDGQTLAVGALFESSNVVGINGNQINNLALESGAVYVFVNDIAGWNQKSYLKSSNTGVGDWFGGSVSLSGDGQTLAVGADGEDSGAKGVGGNQLDNSTIDSGAVYLFVRDFSGWSQQAYLKASNGGGNFGTSLGLSGDGSTLVAGAFLEDSGSVGVNGDQLSNSEVDAGAVYLFVRNFSSWSQKSYLKASNTRADNSFGAGVSLSDNGQALAVGAYLEDGGAVGVNGSQVQGASIDSGAVYLY